MNTLNELFVGYKNSILAKGLGFNKPCHAVVYVDEFIGMGSPDFVEIMLKKDASCIKCPMWDQLVNWFWEEHKMYIVPRLSVDSHPLWWDWVIYSSSTEREAWAGEDESYETKQEALNAAFRWAFDHIK